MSSSAAFRVFTRAAMPFLGASVAARAALLMADEAVRRKMKTVLIEFCDCGWRLCVCVCVVVVVGERERERERKGTKKSEDTFSFVSRDKESDNVCMAR